MQVRNIISLIVVVALIGCGGQPADEPATAEAPPVQSPTAEPDPEPEPETPGEPVAEPVPDPETEAAEEETPQPDEEPESERVRAEAGVGAKGRSLDPHQGVVVTPARTYFTVRERMVFEAQIPSALQMYEATHGHAPRSHEEFMSQVIEANRISLPDLPPDRRYVYDPETKELMVERSL